MRVEILSCVAAAIFLIPMSTSGQQVGGNLSVDLSGQWQFRTGDNRAWTMPEPNEGEWSATRVPNSWESQGFEDYNGFAWYRRAFKLPRQFEKKEFVLHVGRIDDADEVYVNGMFVGSTGTMPPGYRSAYDVYRKYPIPPGILDPQGENIIAIRVYDEIGDGGIMDGQVGLSVLEVAEADIIRLDGRWSFRTGDNSDWSAIETSKEGWSTVTVPGYWEPQGFRGYDGYAWYRTEVFVADRDEAVDFTLALGKIDDLDATYVNGVEVGHTGSVDSANISGDEWQRRREYKIPHDVLRFGEFNVIAVRVYDAMGGGGLYEGPYSLYPQTMSEGALRKALKGLLERVKG